VLIPFAGTQRTFLFFAVALGIVAAAGLGRVRVVEQAGGDRVLELNRGTGGRIRVRQRKRR
jgi:hypothetical protein